MSLWLSLVAPVLLRPERPSEQPCRCGHEGLAHQHYRRGSDCALCPCARYRSLRRVVGAL